jgi:hypothetical protein
MAEFRGSKAEESGVSTSGRDGAHANCKHKSHPEARTRRAPWQFKNVTNDTDHPALFINTETSRDNRSIGPHETTDSIGAWVPWCRREDEFPSHHFQIIDEESDQVIWYIWQRKAADGDFIRASQSGFEDPGSPINGDPATDGDRNLWIDAGGH